MSGRVDVEVAGGTLAAYRIGAERMDAPLVLAIHGITSSSRTWLPAARALEDRAALIAVDLRGRGRSSALPRPFGLAAHVRDMIAVLDRFGVRRSVVVGHSLGAYVATRLAVEHRDRVSGLVLVDGGLRIPGAEGVDREKFLEAFLGPSFARLKMTFPDHGAYRAWWGEHPAFRDGDVDQRDLDEYARHDLVGQPPELRSSVDAQAVRADGIDLFDSQDAGELSQPAVLLCAPRGLLGDPNPMQPLELVQKWAAAEPDRRCAILVPRVNHFTIALGQSGAEAVAREIEGMLERTGAQPGASHP